jgi:hypothetical protein
MISSTHILLVRLNTPYSTNQPVPLESSHQEPTLALFQLVSRPDHSRIEMAGSISASRRPSSTFPHSAYRSRSPLLRRVPYCSRHLVQSVPKWGPARRVRVLLRQECTTGYENGQDLRAALLPVLYVWRICIYRPVAISESCLFLPYTLDSTLDVYEAAGLAIGLFLFLRVEVCLYSAPHLCEDV